MCSLLWCLESGNHVARHSGLEVSPESEHHFIISWIRYHFKVTDSLQTPSPAAGMTWPHSVPPRPGHGVAWGSFDNMGADIPPRRKLQCPFHWNPFLVKHWPECCSFPTGLSSVCWCLHCYFIPSVREKGLKLPACHLLSSVPFITWLQICSWLSTY